LINIIEIITGIITSFIIGIILVFLGIYLIPHNWTIRIIKYLKPSLLKDIFQRNNKYFNSILGILIDGTFTDNYKNEEEAKSRIDEIKNLKNELNKVEQNMFTIDLLSDLYKTLDFAAVNYTMNTTSDVIENIGNYFRSYSSRLEDTSYRRNFASDILNQFEEMNTHIMETKDYESEDSLGERVTKMSRGSASRNFGDYLQNEKTELDKTRNLITDSIKLKAIDLMNNAI
jgi:hypothetical protein